MDGITSRVWTTLILFSFLLVSCGSESDSGDASSELANRKFIVKFKSNSGFGNPNALSGNNVAGLTQSLSNALGQDTAIGAIRKDLFAVEIEQEETLDQIKERLQENNDIEYIEPDYPMFSFLRPNDPSLAQQWAHAVVESEAAWDITQGSDEIVVGVIDTGIDPNHEDLRDRLWKNPGEVPGNGRDDDGNGYVDDVYGWDFANNDNEPVSDDRGFHGTHVSGTVGATGNNGRGGAGHSLKVKLMALKFLGANGSGDTSHAIKAIDYAIEKGVKILNNSWGGSQGSRALEEAVERARAAGILFVAAAGNGGQDGVGDNNDSLPTYPASYTSDNVLTVAATNRSDGLTRFSNFGSRSVHVGAPGEDIYSTQNNNRYDNLSGTSMAAPLVSGLASLVWSVNPNFTYLDVKRILISSVDEVSSLRGRVFSNGRVNARRALELARQTEPGEAPEPPPSEPGPNPDPPNQPPVGSGSPLINGQTQFLTNNPYQPLRVTLDVSGTPGAVLTSFVIAIQGPFGVFPLWNQMLFGSSHEISLYPGAQLPGWGLYFLYAAPLDLFGRQIGPYSAPSTLILSP